MQITRYWHLPTSGAIWTGTEQPNDRWREISKPMFDAILEGRPYWG